MPIRKDLIGDRFGRLLVTVYLGPDKSRNIQWLCRCDCGRNTIALTGNLLSGKHKSCGCFLRDWTTKKSFKHGHSPRGNMTPTYKSWKAMIQRCSDPKVNRYHLYGGRGIKVCERWQKFENFLADMGERPPKHTLERKDNNGNYEPGNVRWATQKEQQNNRRDNHLITHNGETLTLSEWAGKTGIQQATIRRRLKHGWSIEKALCH